MAAQQFEDIASASEAGLLESEESRPKSRRWAIAVPLLGAAAALTWVTARSAGTAGKRTTVSVRGTEILQEGDWNDGSQGDGDGDEGGDEGGCAQPGGDCLESQCCVDGGAEGYQCYKKNDGWAECHAGCEKGAHEGETEGTYDQYGTFKPAEWSCKKLGERSQRDCFGYDNKKDCDTDRCVWGKNKSTDACVKMCSLIGDADTCDGESHCMWYQDKCQPGCGTEAECPEDRCVQGEDKNCLQACWAFYQKKACPKEQKCVWADNMCQDDPCSSPDESCLESKCCSAQRGAEGMTCFKKDKNYAQCKKGCWEDDWDCKALGNRTKLSAGCSWPGEDCSETGLCCQSGFTCAVKDDLFTGCTQTSEKHTWSEKEIPIPADWDGTVLGYSRAEYEMPQAGDDEEVAGDVLFCFMAYLPDSSEVGLMEVAKERNASIFGCDLSAVYESWSSGSQGWDTGEATITNTDVFLNVWNKVDADGLWKKADWTVKVDPDAVIVAERLKWHLGALKPPAYRPIYIKNNGMDPGLGNDGFLGAVEIFSQAAVEIYMDNWEGCRDAFGLDTGEDGFFKGCMDALGVGYMLDVNIFKPDFSPGACANGDMVGFHPIKAPDQWRCCQDLVEGKNRKVDFGKCDMGPDGMGPEEEPPDYVMPR